MKDYTEEFKGMNVSDNSNFITPEPLFEKDSPFGKVVVSQNKALYVHGERMCRLDCEEEKVLASKCFEKIQSTNTLVVGLGCGITLQEVDTQQEEGTIDVIEINPVVTEAQPLFNNVLQSEKVELIDDTDAEVYLLNEEDEYDLIIVDVSNPCSEESNKLFNEAFHQLVKSRVCDGGLIAFWNFKTPEGFAEEHFELFKQTFPDAIKEDLDYSSIYFSR